MCTKEDKTKIKLLYLISTREKAEKNEYKLGRHNGTITQLIRRYQTALIDPIIYFSIPIENYVIAESLLKIRLYNYRLENNNGRKSEWICLTCSKIIKYIKDVIILDAKSELELTYNEELIKYKALDKHLIRKKQCGNKNYYRNNLLSKQTKEKINIVIKGNNNTVINGNNNNNN